MWVMLATIADRLGVSLRRAERMAIAAAKAGLVKLEFGTITMTGEGQERGLMPRRAPLPRLRL